MTGESIIRVRSTSAALRHGVFITMSLAIVAYAGALFYADGPASLACIRQVSVASIAIASFLSLANFAIRWIRWHLYLRCVEAVTPIDQSILIFLTGFVMSLSPGKSGELFKSVMVRSANGAPLALTAPVVVAERVTDVIGLLLLGAGALLWTTHSVVSLILLAILTVCLIGLLGSHQLSTFAIEQITRFERTARWREKLLEVQGALRSLFTLSRLSWAMSLSVLAWTMHALSLLVVAHSFEGVPLSLAQATIAYAAPLLAGALVMIPGGLGMTEASMTGVIMKQVEVSLPVATAITMVVRLVTFWLAIGLGTAALIIWQVRWRDRLSSVDVAT